MHSIGGYFELELRKGEHYHPKALRLNTARNCFEYVLRARGYKKVYIPYYTCDVMLEPFKKLGIAHEFYHINQKLEPIETLVLKSNEAFLYTNYFGLKQKCVERLAGVYGNQLIVDNAQAFYAAHLDWIDTFYSPRKFFGVPDGGYLYTNKLLKEEIKQDYSFDRMGHLLIRADKTAEEGYPEFKKNSHDLVNNPIRKMSKLTEKILSSIDYSSIIKIRQENYKFLNSVLGKRNKFAFPLNDDDVPMVYPFYTEDKNLRQKLIQNKVYVATYWPNVFDWCKTDTLEFDLAKNILPLPIDQRYGEREMEKIVAVIENR